MSSGVFVSSSLWGPEISRMNILLLRGHLADLLFSPKTKRLLENKVKAGVLVADFKGGLGRAQQFDPNGSPS